MRRLIADPARLAGLHFERNEQTKRGLDDLVLQDTAVTPAPCHSCNTRLSELYQRRDRQRRTLTFAAYEAMGGVRRRWPGRPTRPFNRFPGRRGAIDEILPLLVAVDAGGEQVAVRSRAPLVELTATLARRELVERADLPAVLNY